MEEGVTGRGLSPLLFLLSFLFLAAAPAKELVKFPAGPAAWVVEIREASSSVPLPRSPAPEEKGRPVTLKKVEVVQDQEKRRAMTLWSNGRTRENWSISGMDVTLAESPGGKTFVSMDKVPFEPSAFSWLKPEFLQDKDPVSYEGKKCYHYKGEVERFSPMDGVSTGKVLCEAWIEAQTLLPVGLFDGEMLGVFTFKAPEGTLKLPEKFQKRLDYYKVVMGMP